MVGTIDTWAWMKYEYGHQQNWKETALKMNSICCWRPPTHNYQGDNSINVDQIIKGPAQTSIWTHTCTHTYTHKRHEIVKDNSFATVEPPCQTGYCYSDVVLPVTLSLKPCGSYLSLHKTWVLYVVFYYYMVVFSGFPWNFGGIATCSLW